MVVLIDTWWNVNKYSDKGYDLPPLSFNRYMVECKFVFNIIMLFK